MAEQLDLDRIAKLLGVAGSSQHDGEAINAIRMTDRLLRAAGLGWQDLVAPFRELEIAKEATIVLMAREQQLRDLVEQLRSSNSSAAAVPWTDVGPAASSPAGSAKWLLELYDDCRIWLSVKERDFLGTVSRWHGRLTPRQQPWFDEILARACAKTGLQPP